MNALTKFTPANVRLMAHRFHKAMQGKFIYIAHWYTRKELK